MKIQSNGSKWAGEAPDTLEVLLDVLKTETLDPTFEQYGGFFYRLPGDERYDGEYHAFGNFLTVSHVFSIYGTLEELRPLAQALKLARSKPEYLKEKAARERREGE
jgi:hypothetical protein